MAYGATFHKSARQLDETGAPFVYTPENRARFDEIVTRYPPDRRALGGAAGALSRRSTSRATSPPTRCATSPSCSASRRADVEDVVSYYTMFYTRPVGKFVLQRVPHAVVRAERRRARHRGVCARSSASRRARPTRAARSR